MNSYLSYVVSKNAQMDRAMLDILNPLAPEILTGNQKSFYKNLKSLVEHMLKCNAFFLNLCAQSFPKQTLDIPIIEEEMTFPDTAQALLKTDQLFIDLIKNISPEEEVQSLSFKDNKIPAGEMVLKWYAHNVHHRGQVSQILDSLNIKNNWSVLS